MSTVSVYNLSKEEVGSIDLNDAVFGAEVKDHLMHLVVRWQLACRRQGTHNVKNRSDVTGGGRKPWKQKGTGRARQGSSRSPQWRGGGSVWGPHPRSYAFKVNKKERRAALRSALSKRLADQTLWVVDGFNFDAPKTKSFVAFLERFALSDALLVLGDANVNVELAARNLPNVTVLPTMGVNVYDVLKRKNLVLTRAAADQLAERLGG